MSLGCHECFPRICPEHTLLLQSRRRKMFGNDSRSPLLVIITIRSLQRMILSSVKSWPSLPECACSITASIRSTTLCCRALVGMPCSAWSRRTLNYSLILKCICSSIRRSEKVRRQSRNRYALNNNIYFSPLLLDTSPIILKNVNRSVYVPERIIDQIEWMINISSKPRDSDMNYFFEIDMECPAGKFTTKTMTLCFSRWMI